MAHLPNGWEHGGGPGRYFYNELLVRSIDRGRNLIELVARKDGKRISATGMNLKKAMKSFEEKLNRVKQQN